MVPGFRVYRGFYEGSSRVWGLGGSIKVLGFRV